MKRQVFVQSELLADVAVLEVEHDTSPQQLRQSVLELFATPAEEVILFVEDEDDENALVVLVEIPEGLRVHAHRLRSIEVKVRYAGNEVRRAFRPGATVAKVKRWATADLRISPSDAAEMMLQVSGTNNRPDADVHIGTLVHAPAHRLAFDLVPSPRVNG
jgi:hypothetical protein